MYYSRKPIVRNGPPVDAPNYFGQEYFDQSPGGLTYIATFNPSGSLEWIKSSISSISSGDIDFITADIQYNSPFPFPIYSVTENIQVVSARLIVSEAFNGAPSVTLSVGDDGNHNKIIPATKVNPAVVGTYTLSPNVNFTLGGQIKLYKNVVSGATTGQATVILEYIRS